MSYKKKNTNCSLFLILLKLLLLLILYSADLAVSSTCQRECGGVTIPYPFGIGNDCYLDKSYEIECRNSNTTPFLSVISKEVVSISLPFRESHYTSLSYPSVRVRIPITSAGCNGKDSGSVVNLTSSPFFIDGKNKLVAVGCNAKVSLTDIKPNMVGCELNCSASKVSKRNTIPFLDKSGCSSNTNDGCTESSAEETGCDGNGCCQAWWLQGWAQVLGS